MNGSLLDGIRELPNYRTAIAIGLPVIGGALALASSILTPRGKAKGLLTGAYTFLACVGVACLFYALIAWVLGESGDVIFCWLMPGIVLTVIMGIFTPEVIRGYQQFELRKLAAAIFRRT